MFWSLTPRELFACFDEWRESERMANYRAGVAAAAVYNVNRVKKSAKFIQPLDFFESRHRVRGRSAEEIDADLTKLWALKNKGALA